jgi:heme A synthase
MYTHPPIAPVTKAAHGAITAHPAVMATNPERAPFIHIVMSYSISPVFLLLMIISVRSAETDPVAALIVVVTAARALTAADSLLEMVPKT